MNKRSQNKNPQPSEPTYPKFSKSEWESVPEWKSKYLLIQAEFHTTYPHTYSLFSRFQSPFSYESWRAAMPGLLMALFVGLFALSLSSENRILLFQNWYIYSAVFFLLFGILAAIKQSSNHIYADDYLSVTAFWLHCTWLATIFKIASGLHPYFAIAYLFCFATSLAMINILTCYYFLSLFFKFARI